MKEKSCPTCLKTHFFLFWVPDSSLSVIFENYDIIVCTNVVFFKVKKKLDLSKNINSNHYNSHNELKHEKKTPISNVCLGGCMIASKTKINVFLYKKLHSGCPSVTLHLKI